MYLLDPSGSWKNPIILGLSMPPSCCLSESFLGIGSLDFSDYWLGARNPEVVCETEFEFLEKYFFCFKSWGSGPKIEFLEFKEKFGHYFSLNLLYNENLYYLLCPCTNPILGKILF